MSDRGRGGQGPVWLRELRKLCKLCKLCTERRSSRSSRVDLKALITRSCKHREAGSHQAGREYMHSFALTFLPAHNNYHPTAIYYLIFFLLLVVVINVIKHRQDHSDCFNLLSCISSFASFSLSNHTSIRDLDVLTPIAKYIKLVKKPRCHCHHSVIHTLVTGERINILNQLASVSNITFRKNVIPFFSWW